MSSARPVLRQHIGPMALYFYYIDSQRTALRFQQISRCNCRGMAPGQAMRVCKFTLNARHGTIAVLISLSVERFMSFSKTRFNS